MDNLTSVDHVHKKSSLIGLRNGAGEKVLATSDVGSISGSHAKEGENWRLQVVKAP